MTYLTWYINPWRLFTLFIGTSILYYGAHVAYAPDWDANVSYLMAGTTYLLMPLFDRWIRRKETIIAAFLCGDFAVNTTYTLYWDWMENIHVSALANYGASWSLFLACWLIWSLVPETLETFPKAAIRLRHFIKGTWSSGAE